ncbi:MAG: hypothetical protein KAR20_19780, partial [Candidatus Heimdallarchaeota archaeon]|nr:hypothetical protein [Candidatus Heimdallarchaeota archaeon]
MKKILTAVLTIIFIAGSAYAETFDIGNTKLVIPSPQGFSLVTQEMDAVYRLSLQMSDPKNDNLAYYISDFSIPKAVKGELPAFERTFWLKVIKQLKNAVITSKDFSKFKSMVKRQNENIFKKIKSKVSKAMKENSEGISKEFDINYAMKVSQVVPIDPHYETNNAFAYSMYINYGYSSAGTKTNNIVSNTSTFVNVSGKLISLYCYGSESDLEWTRLASKLWAEKIIESNNQPSTSPPAD